MQRTLDLTPEYAAFRRDVRDVVRDRLPTDIRRKVLLGLRLSTYP
ncbi:MAG: hypothetical protein ACP5NM_06320 [Thiomonas sp.]